MAAAIAPSRVVIAAFDGNDRRFPTLLAKGLSEHGVHETTVAEDGPDEVRIITAPGLRVRNRAEAGRATRPEDCVTVLRPLHAAAYVEQMHQGNGCLLRLPDGTTVAVLAYNCGRADKASQVDRSLASMAEVLDGTQADVKVFIGLEFGEGDHLYDGQTEHQIARRCFAHERWREYFPDTRETMFVSRHIGPREDDVSVVRGSSVKRQSPTREVISLSISKYSLTILAFHSAAGWHNGHRPRKIKRLLGISWRLTLVRARDRVAKYIAV